MGRPLNKKYFGNKNSPYTDFQGITTPDSGIGGEGVASVTLSAQGAYTTRATVTFSAPQLPTGVTATGTVTMEASTATVVDGKTGYIVGDLLTFTGSGGAIARVATIDGDGTVLTVEFTGTGAARGEQTALTDITTGVVTASTSAAGEDGVTLDIVYRAKAVVITNAGSGYVSAADALPTFSNGVSGAGDKAAGAAVLLAARYNAILAEAFITGGGAKQADIIKQSNDRRYKVETADGVGVCQLKASAVDAAGEMTIKARDSAGNVYYITKLTSRKAVLTREVADNGQFATGASVPWTLGAAVENYSVQVENA